MILQTDEIGEVKDLVHDINLVLLAVISLCCRVCFFFYFVLFSDTGPLQIKYFVNSGGCRDGLF